MTYDPNDISPIELLTHVIEQKATTGPVVADALLNDELDDWLVIFRSTANLAAALSAVRVALDGAGAADVCDAYLSALLGLGSAP
jgi:hypothetical protein